MPYETSFARFQKETVNTVSTDPGTQAIQVIQAAAPTASAPTEGLPSDATPGRFYVFASRPSTLYTIGTDNIWRAVVLVSVV